MDSITSASLFTRLAHLLDDAKICHMLTGSFAASIYGRIRGSPNVNFIIEANEAQIRALCQLTDKHEFSSDLETALQACRNSSSFELFDSKTSLRIALCFRDERFGDEFERRRSFPVTGGSLCVAQAEDLIIAELYWTKTIGSARQIEDVAGILNARFYELDLPYLNSRITQLGISEQWFAACKAAGFP